MTTRVNKDNWFHHIRCTDVTKIPIYNDLDQVGDEPGMEGDIILRRDTQEFCFHDGNTWVCMKAGGDDVTLTDACGTGINLVFGAGMGPALFIKGLTQSDGIVLTDNGAGCVNIATAITLATSCGTGVSLVADGTGPNLLVKGLTASDGIVLSDDGSCVNIATAITLANACGTGINLVADGTGPNLLVKGLTASDGIVLSDDGSCVNIATAITLANACGTGINLVADGTGPNLAIKGLTASDGIVLSDDGSCVNIATAITLANACATGVNLVADGTGPDLLVKGLTQSDGIVLSDDGSCVNIATAITLANACATGVNLVADGTGPDLLIKGLTQSNGIVLSDDGSCVNIATAITLDTACGTGINLVADGTGPNLLVKGLVPGFGVGITEDGSCVTITNTDPASSVTLSNACGTGVSLVVNGDGPNLQIRGLVEGVGITLRDIGSCVTIDADCCPCKPTPLTDNDLVAGVITLPLSASQRNYCFAENITGDILISGDNITVDGNDRLLIGRVTIDAVADAIFKNAKVKPLAPVIDPAGSAGIEIVPQATNPLILNCLVECSSGNAVDGRTAINSSAPRTTIDSCHLIAGDGLGSSVGGDGLSIVADDATIKNTFGIGGSGPDGGGDGILVSGDNGMIMKSKGFGGSSSTSAGNAIVILNDSDTVIVKECVVNGGSASTTGMGGHGIVVRGGSPSATQNIQICNCKVNNVGLSQASPPDHGSGILIEDGVECVQVVSNRVSCCPGIGIENDAGAQAVFGNNASTLNGTNYSGVSPTASITGSPAPTYWENVTE